MKSCQMNSWMGDKRTQSAEEVKRTKDNMSGIPKIGKVNTNPGLNKYIPTSPGDISVIFP